MIAHPYESMEESFVREASEKIRKLLSAETDKRSELYRARE